MMHDATSASDAPEATIEARVSALRWNTIADGLDKHGVATTGELLTPSACDRLSGAYGEANLYRSRVIMARHGFGSGEYQYYAYPLPEVVQSLRPAFYAKLAPVANAWNAMLGIETRFPAAHEDYLAVCHAAGQTRPTPLILRYAEGDYNCLHQDVYGDLLFPFQVAFLLSEPERDFTGGAFVLTEQRPRMQSRAEVAPLHKGEGVIFPVRHRPVHGTRGIYRTAMRHGVSRILSGQRFTLGIIFHDAM